MALEIVVGFASNMEEHVDVEDVTSSCYSVINGYEPSSPSLISSSGSTDEPTDNAVSAMIVAHFMSLALTAPCCVSVLRSSLDFPHSPGHVLRDAVVNDLS
jgi:hypothetical protein